MERYRSGHNGAVLKTVCLHGRMGSNPILSVKPLGLQTMVITYSKKFSYVWRSTQEAEGAPLERE